MRTSRKVGAVVAAAVILVGLGLGISLSRSSSNPPVATAPATTSPSACLPDPAVQIAALPAGGTFNGTGHCYDTLGIKVTKAVTIDGGIYNESVGYKPIIQVVKGAGVTIENVTLNGSNTAHGYHAKYVSQAGIDVRGSTNLRVEDVKVDQTYGDGLTLAWGNRTGADVNVTVSDFTATSVGRQGMTVADVHGGRFTDINIVSAAEDGIDFETDTGMEPQDSNVSFDGVTAKGINIVQPLHYVSFTKTTVHGFHMTTDGWVSFSGSFICHRSSPVPCVTVASGWLTIEPGTSFAYEPGRGTPTEKLLKVGAKAIVTGGP